jgi:hypothetical protein
MIRCGCTKRDRCQIELAAQASSRSEPQTCVCHEQQRSIHSVIPYPAADEACVQLCEQLVHVAVIANFVYDQGVASAHSVSGQGRDYAMCKIQTSVAPEARL